MRETNRMLELYQNLLFKHEKYGKLPTEEAKLMSSLNAFIRARAYLMEQQHLQAGDIVAAQRIAGENEVGPNDKAATNVQRTESRESTPSDAESPRPDNQ